MANNGCNRSCVSQLAHGLLRGQQLGLCAYDGKLAGRQLARASNMRLVHTFKRQTLKQRHHTSSHRRFERMLSAGVRVGLEVLNKLIDRVVGRESRACLCDAENQ